MRVKKTTLLLILALLLAAIAAYAVARFLDGDDAGAGADAGDARLVALGRTVYAEHCAACHGARLEGQPEWRRRLDDGTLPAPPHDASGHTWHHPDALLFAYTKQGGAATAPKGFTSAMPAFGGTLTDRRIWAVLAYIKSRWPDTVRARQAGIDRASR